MKKYLYLLIISVSSLILNGCDVDVINPNTLTKATFWKTERDAEYGVNAIYNMFYKPGTYSRWIWFRLDLTSDEGWSQSPWAELKEWTRFQYVNYNFWEGNAWTYRDCYEAIFRANQALENIPNIEMDETVKNQLLGQAYFLRGLYYYNLALLWGSENNSLPIILTPSNPADTPQGYNGEDVYNQSISDLSQAVNMLPEQWDSNNLGRATKGAAYALRAKCYMQLHKWEEAKNDLYWLVEGNGKQYYDLVAKYEDNFTKDTENNKESVFEIQYSDVHKAPAGDGDFDVDPNLGLNRGQFFAPPGIGWTDGELRPWIVNEFKKEKDLSGNYDIRLKYTAFYEGMNQDFPENNRIYRYRLDGADSDIWNLQNWKGRVFFRKYGSDYYRDYDDYHNPTNVRLIRFADVLLMYAECIANTDNDLSKAVGLVNRVRQRVNMPELKVNHFDATQSKDAFLKRLQMERSLELCSEGQRWADIKRWGLVDNQGGIDELIARDEDFRNFVIGKHNCLPIPSDDVNNNPNQQQNPNY
ncbi:MAG TPA: RagB/SusD family nutrient uptake outer membrane protein [Dysgonamonadaceae bacterium]|jgi:hypothetical protein|nr:RagB/SusD family nutrient uptake outer membrane protein [Dysgonamonadaceae bacterium]HOV36839.1 RagB/SusD family nutrient uptake outer membrane protein [Dysgonamonadaceae bacterium]HPD43305.1 RagB/SusD family nutrient uptake outer membrane protein [Dysgonamonadaceae bacterium]HRS40885.1 RagB/SusD family nutrient uptake outer membrane protein [Dysgonamonadaceae bacterium]HRU13243.1 RagB/SusD family nutrient uptake outer membrane protein [Dysgonamonadaceae bacterium]